MVSTGKNQPAGWSLRLLGGFELVGPEGTVDVPPGVQKLLAYTALQGRSVTRARVATWIGSSKNRLAPRRNHGLPGRYARRGAASRRGVSRSAADVLPRARGAPSTSAFAA